MFGIKGRDTFNNPLSDRAQLARTLKKKWLQYFPYLLAIAIISAVAFLGYVWYAYVYTKELSQEEKTVYMNQKKQETTFRRKKFDEVKEQINMRKEKFEAASVSQDDIFYHVSIEETVDQENENTVE